MAIGEHEPTGRLVDGQIVRFDNLHSARGGTSVFRIVLNNGGDIHEVEHQIVRRFVRSERVNRVDHHKDLCHDARFIRGLIFTSQELWLGCSYRHAKPAEAQKKSTRPGVMIRCVTTWDCRSGG